MSRLHLIGGLAATALALGALAGCTGDDEDGKDGKATESPASVDPGKVSPTDLPEVPSIDGAKGAIKDVSFGDCGTDAGEQEVTGTVRSTAKKQLDYVITVSWVTDQSDVRTRAVEVVENLEPGESKDFTLTADVPEGISTCTFHVVRGTL